MNEPRPLNQLRKITARYPNAWKLAADMRQRKGSDLPDWPDWCYLPIAAAYAIVSGGGALRPEQGPDIGRVAALAAWRVTKGIYRFDADLFDALWATPLTGHLPDDLLERLPEWCCYVETPGRKWINEPLHGFYVHLESDANNGRRELRLLLDLETNGLLPVPLHLTGGNLTEAVERAWAEANKHGANFGDDDLLLHSQQVARFLAPLISLVLYLCSEEPDVAEANGSARKPANPQPKRTRQGTKEFPADAVSGWNVGWRVGAALRSAQYRAGRSSQGGEHASPRAHIRVAHWHTFLTGAGRTNRVLRWLPPILVNAGDSEMPAVTRDVPPS